MIYQICDKHLGIFKTRVMVRNQKLRGIIFIAEALEDLPCESIVSILGQS